MPETLPVDVWRGIDTIPGDLAERLSVNSGVPFFRSIEWFGCLAAHGTSGAAPRVYIDTGGADPVALFCVPRDRRLNALVSFYSIEFGAAGTGDLQPLLDFIAAERPRWHTLEFRNLSTAALNELKPAAERAGFAAHDWRQYANWCLPLDGKNFERYYAGRASRLRNTIERKQRKAQRDHDFRLAVYPRGELSLEAAIDGFNRVYSSSWKEPEPFPDFVPELIRTCAGLDAARVGVIWIDDRPAAAQFWIRDGRRSFVYKLAYDESFAALSVGSILSRAMFADAIDVDRIDEIDYGVGDETYKRDWMTERRALHGLLAFDPRSPRGMIGHLRQTLSARLRRRRRVAAPAAPDR